MFAAENTARENLADFVLFCRKLKGNEKKESQTFLDRLFKAFGHEGAIEAGAGSSYTCFLPIALS